MVQELFVNYQPGKVYERWAKWGSLELFCFQLTFHLKMVYSERHQYETFSVEGN